MPASFRLILLLGAILCGGFVALLGGGFSRAVEPEAYSAGTSAFWLLAGAIVAAPLWVPAIFPSRYAVALKFCRWVSAAALLVPTLLFGSIVWHNISRSVSGLGATSLALVQGALLTVVCLVCMVILMWPELRTCAKRAT
jgi:hypothetical protein